MSSVEQLTAVDRLSEPNQSGSDSFSSCGGGPTWDLLGDLMIDLGGNNANSVTEQGPLKMQNSSVSENLAPTSAKPDSDKGLTLKMKIKRKSKNEEKHEIVTPEMEKFRLLSGPSVKLEDADPAHVPQAKKSRLDKIPQSAVRHASSGSSSGNSNSSIGGKRDAWANTTTVGTEVEPDCLGPCDSGSSISLDGVVWLETDTGVLVVNVSWRGRTYVGTLLDSSRHDFAPPTSTSTVNGQNSNPEDPEASNSNGGSRWCHQQLQAQQQALQLNGQHHHHHSLAYQHAQQHHGGRGGRGNRRRAGRPTARQLPLANGGGSGGNGSTASSAGSELPHIRCPEPGCDKRFAQLQALKWHSINQHCLTRPSHRQQHRSNLREEKSLDGSSVFKVPQQANKAASGSGVVTVSKTCPVPAGLPTPSISFKAIQPKSTSSGCTGRASSTAGRRSADPVSPAYSDISDEGGAPVLEREDEQQQHLHHGHHRDRLQHQSLSRSLSAVEVSRAKSLPPKEQQHQKVPSAKSQSVPSATAPAAAGSDTAAESPAAAAPPRTPLSSGAPQPKPSLGRSPSDSEAAAAAAATPAAIAALSKAPSSAPVSSTATPTRPMLQPSPRRRPSKSPSASSASSPRFQQHQQNPGPAAAAVAALAASSGLDPYRLLGAGGVQQSPYQLPGIEALSQYAAAAAAMSSGRQQQQQQQQSQHLQQQQLHQQHKIHELSRNSSPKASPPLAQFGPAGVPQHPPNRHHQLHQQQHHLASLHHHQQQQHRGQPPLPHHLMEQFNLPFSLASQMMHGGPPPPHYLQPK